MPLTIPNCLTEATGWGDTVTVTLAADGTDSLHTQGTANFVWTRVSLASLLARPDLLFTDGLDFDGELLSQKFVVAQFGVGEMPGWIVAFGSQPTQQKAFLYTITNPGQPDEVVYLDADCSAAMTCAPIAPDLYAYAQAGFSLGDGGAAGLALFPGLNTGLQPDPGNAVTAAAYTVTLIRPGFPADASTKRAAIPPVYRVELPEPTETLGITDFSILLNGETRSQSGYNGQNPGGLFGFLVGSALAGNAGSYAGTVSLRSQGVCEVQTVDYGDVLAAGTVSYCPQIPVPSTLTLDGFRDITLTIDDPFPMAGQTIRSQGELGGGFTATVQF